MHGLIVFLIHFRHEATSRQAKIGLSQLRFRRLRQQPGGRPVFASGCRVSAPAFGRKSGRSDQHLTSSTLYPTDSQLIETPQKSPGLSCLRSKRSEVRILSGVPAFFLQHQQLGYSLSSPCCGPKCENVSKPYQNGLTPHLPYQNSSSHLIVPTN